MNKELQGCVVVYKLDPKVWGVAEYFTADGWVGIRQPGGRLDEVRADLIRPDRT